MPFGPNRYGGPWGGGLLEGIAFTPLGDDEGEIAGVLELYRRSIRPLWDARGRDYDLGRIEANIREKLGREGYSMMVARRGAELVGYWAWEKHPDHTSSHVVAHLRMILVRPDLQGEGLGRAMIERFEDAARAAGCTKVLFDVIVGSPAYDFYLARGYRHWSNFMEKRLDEPSS